MGGRDSTVPSSLPSVTHQCRFAGPQPPRISGRIDRNVLSASFQKVAIMQKAPMNGTKLPDCESFCPVHAGQTTVRTYTNYNHVL